MHLPEEFLDPQQSKHYVSESHTSKNATEVGTSDESVVYLISRDHSTMVIIRVDIASSNDVNVSCGVTANRRDSHNTFHSSV